MKYIQRAGVAAIALFALRIPALPHHPPIARARRCHPVVAQLGLLPRLMP